MRKLALVVLLLVTFVTGCSSDSASGPLRCEDDFATIVDLVRSGLPTYDYEPADSLQQLIDWSDLVVVGSVDAISRVEGAEEMTVISSSDLEVVSGTASGASLTSVAYASVWAEDGADPLVDPVAVDGLSFIAFLVQVSPGQYTPLVQGLQMGCGQSELVTPVIADLPMVPPGASIDELVVLL